MCHDAAGTEAAAARRAARHGGLARRAPVAQLGRGRQGRIGGRGSSSGGRRLLRRHLLHGRRHDGRAEGPAAAPHATTNWKLKYYYQKLASVFLYSAYTGPLVPGYQGSSVG